MNELATFQIGIWSQGYWTDIMSRWVWFCGWENGSSSWKDSERCLSCSRKPLSIEKDAQEALERHQNRTGHYSKSGHVRKLKRNEKW